MIEVNPNYTEINAEEERRDPESVYSYYRRLTRLRKEYPCLVDGRFDLLMEEGRADLCVHQDNYGE